MPVVLASGNSSCSSAFLFFCCPISHKSIFLDAIYCKSIQSRNILIFLMHAYMNIYRYVRLSSLHALLGFSAWWWGAGMIHAEFRRCQVVVIFFWIPGLEFLPFLTNSLRMALAVLDIKMLITMEKHVQKQTNKKTISNIFKLFVD